MMSMVKIDSIYIDLDEAFRTTDIKELCGRFSIRAYVSEVRKKDQKICWPFSSDNDSEEQSGLVYGSQQCMDPGYNGGKDERHCSCDRNADSSGNHMPLQSPKEKPMARCQKVCMAEEEKEDIADAVYNSPSISKTNKDVTVGTTNASNEGPKNVLEDGNDNIMSRPAESEYDIHPNLPPVDISYMNQMPVKDVSTIKISSGNGQIGGERVGCGMDKGGDVADKPIVNSITSDSSKNGSLLGFNARDESIPVGKKVGRKSSEHHGSSSSSKSRKLRKIRLLTDLLGENDYSSFHLANSVSVDPKTAGKNSINQDRKKNVPHGEELRPELTHQAHGRKKAKIHDCGEHSYHSPSPFRCEASHSVEEASQIHLNNCSGRDRTYVRPMPRTKRIDKILLCQRGSHDVSSENLEPTGTHENFVIAQAVDARLSLNKHMNKGKSGFQCTDSQKSNVHEVNDVKAIEEKYRMFPWSSPECVQNNGNDCCSIHENRLNFTQEQLGFSREQRNKNNKVCKVIPSTYVRDGFSSERKFGNMKTGGTINEIPFLMKKQNGTLEGKTETFSLSQQKHITGVHDNGKHAWAPSQKDVTKNDQSTDKAIENLDDIPMDIVELLARHRYERSLQDRKNNHLVPGPENNITSSARMNFEEIPKNGTLRLFPEHCSDLNSRSGNMFSDRMHPISPKSVNLTPGSSKELIAGHSSMGQVGETYNCMPSNHGLPQQWSGYFTHDPNYSIDQGAGCRSKGDLMRQRLSLSCMQGSGACSSSRTIFKEGIEASSILPSVTIKDVPQIGIYASDQNSYKGSLNGNHPVDKLNLSISSNERLNQKFCSEIANKVLAEHSVSYKQNAYNLQANPFSPLDLCMNETVPAMHLLSLMDGALLSQNPIKINQEQNLFNEYHDSYSRGFVSRESSRYGATKNHENYTFESNKRSRHLQNSGEFHPAHPLPRYMNCRNINFCPSFTTETSSRHNSEGKTLSSLSRKRHCKTLKPMLKNCNLPIKHTNVLPETQKNPAASFEPAMLSWRCSSDDFLKQSGLHGCSKLSVLPVRRVSNLETCVISKNPADFSVPEAGNIYMIEGKDLRFGELSLHSKDCSVSEMHRQNNRKPGTRKAICKLLKHVNA